jgi:hypothetical protein
MANPAKNLLEGESGLIEETPRRRGVHEYTIELSEQHSAALTSEANEIAMEKPKARKEELEPVSA